MIIIYKYLRFSLLVLNSNNRTLFLEYIIGGKFGSCLHGAMQPAQQIRYFAQQDVSALATLVCPTEGPCICACFVLRYRGHVVSSKMMVPTSRKPGMFQ
jgi:hypothetical protein